MNNMRLTRVGKYIMFIPTPEKAAQAGELAQWLKTNGYDVEVLYMQGLNSVQVVELSL